LIKSISLNFAIKPPIIMDQKASQRARIDIELLTEEALRPFGWLLGKAMPADSSLPVFSNAYTSFWQEHLFDPGAGGETEMLSVIYRNTERTANSLEVHRVTQQAVIPLTGNIIQILALSLPDGSPDIASLRAFPLKVGQGICMRPGCWHATRVDSAEVHCLMLTRRSTTVDLIAHLATGTVLLESEITTVYATLPA
jgi:ureidoglycolate lyase